ncbi:MAG: glycosyltransferase family 87 protein, partial [Planctomycetota bacterium]
MSEILLYYKRPDPTTWVYMSSFLTIGLYFVFRRFWSVRNLDIVLLILLAPGLLIVYEGRRREIRQVELLVRQKTQQADDAGRDDTETDEATTMTSLLGVFPAFAVSQPPGSAESDGAEGNEPSDLDANQASASSESDSISSADSDSGQDSNGIQRSPTAPAPLQAGSVSDEPTDQENAPESESGEGEEISPSETSVYAPKDIQRFGFIYLFIVEAIILLRLMIDPLMDRRPLLDPNLTTGGLNFIGISLFIFMMANVIASSPRIQQEQGPKLGPGYALMNMLPAIPTRPVSDAVGGAAERPSKELDTSLTRLSRIAKSIAIFAQLSVVSAIVLIGNRHFSNLRAGVGCATLYLMLPYTAQMTGRVDHVLPAALLLWAVLCHRRPMIAGIFLGLAGGLVYYPLFLLPLWF